MIKINAVHIRTDIGRMKDQICLILHACSYDLLPFTINTLTAIYVFGPHQNSSELNLNQTQGTKI